MTTPPFTAEQLEYAKTVLPTGIYARTFGTLTPSTDAQQVGAYAWLSAEQRKALDDAQAAKAAQAQVDAAQAALAAAQAQAQAAVQAAQGTDVDTSALTTPAG